MSDVVKISRSKGSVMCFLVKKQNKNRNTKNLKTNQNKTKKTPQLYEKSMMWSAIIFR